MKINLEIKYGLIIGLGVAAWIMLEFALGFHGRNIQIGQYSGYVAGIIPIVALWFAVGEKREKFYGGSMTIMQGLKMSFLISLLAGVIMAVFMFIYIQYINPAFIEYGLELQIEALRQQGLTEDEIQAAATFTLGLLTAPVQAAGAFLGGLLQGTFIGFIITLIRRKKKYATKVSGTPNSQPPSNTP